MAFARRKNKWVKPVLLVILCLIIITGLTTGGYFLLEGRYKQAQENYQAQISVLNNQINSQKKTVLIPNNTILAGEVLTEHMFTEVVVSSSILQDRYMSKADFGTYALIDLEANTPVFNVMLTKDLIANDLREEELNMFLLPSNIKTNDYVDIRINFANGEDYIVLSKKKVQDIDLDKNTLWLWLDEKEILTISSAIIDAYLHQGTKLYTVTYVEPTLQDPAIANYPVNNDVLLILQDNPNILDEATESMTAEARAYLEERLAYLSEEELSNVDSGVNEENAQREETINEASQESEEENEVVAVPGTSAPSQDEPSVTETQPDVTEGEETSDEGFFN